MNLEELERIHLKAAAVYRKANDIALHHFRKITDFERKNDDGRISIVTQADYEINDLFIAELPRLLPGSGVIGEEGSAYSQEDYVWVIDPIDGTGNYQKGWDLWGSLISLWHQGRPIYAAMLFPTQQQEMLYGFANGDVFTQDAKRVTLKESAAHKPAYCFCSTADHDRLLLDLYTQDYGQQLSFRKLGSTAMEAYNLVYGNYDFIVIYKLAGWDVGAIIALAHALGMRIKYFDKALSPGDKKFSTYNHSLMIYKPDLPEMIYTKVVRVVDSYKSQN